MNLARPAAGKGGNAAGKGGKGAKGKGKGKGKGRGAGLTVSSVRKHDSSLKPLFWNKVASDTAGDTLWANKVDDNLEEQAMHRSTYLPTYLRVAESLLLRCPLCSVHVQSTVLS